MCPSKTKFELQQQSQSLGLSGTMYSQIASQAPVSRSVYLVPVAAVVHCYSIISENHNEDTPSFGKDKDFHS